MIDTGPDLNALALNTSSTVEDKGSQDGVISVVVSNQVLLKKRRKIRPVISVRLPSLKACGPFLKIYPRQPRQGMFLAAGSLCGPMCEPMIHARTAPGDVEMRACKMQAPSSSLDFRYPGVPVTRAIVQG